MKLRDYQEEAVQSIYDYFMHKTGNPIVVAPTGSGKSVIIGEFLRRTITAWPNQRVLVLSHVKELLQQNYERLIDLWPGADVGLYSAGLGKRQFNNTITIAGIQSVYKKAGIFNWVDLILVDECHLLSDNNQSMYRNFIDDLRAINRHLKVIGFSATPYRTKGGSLVAHENRLFTDVCIDVPVIRLIEEGYLSPLSSKLTDVRADLSGVHTRGGEFIASEAEAVMNIDSLTQAALNEVDRLGSQRQSAIYFCVGVDHAIAVRDALRARGKRAECVVGSTPKEERAMILDQFKGGRIDAITNANVLTTGFDAPNIDLIVLLRPTKSAGLYVQMLGRGMRLHPGKINCLVLDFAGNIERFGPVDRVSPPRSKESTVSVTPVKQCPECGEAVHIAAMECPDCGFIFETIAEEREKHDDRASNAAVLSIEETGSQPITVEVDRVTYHKHEPHHGGPPSLRVEYHCGLIDRYKEWVCLEHEGYARAKAEKWWAQRYEFGFMPASVDQALPSTDALKTPSHITVYKSGKYWRILNYEFDETSRESAFA